MTDKPLSAMARREMYLQDVRQQGFRGQRLPDDVKWSLDRSVQLRGGTVAPPVQTSAPKLSAIQQRCANLQRQRDQGRLR
jgi:hypothetical protein